MIPWISWRKEEERRRSYGMLRIAWRTIGFDCRLTLRPYPKVRGRVCSETTTTMMRSTDHRHLCRRRERQHHQRPMRIIRRCFSGLYFRLQGRRQRREGGGFAVSRCWSFPCRLQDLEGMSADQKILVRIEAIFLYEGNHSLPLRSCCDRVRCGLTRLCWPLSSRSRGWRSRYQS